MGIRIVLFTKIPANSPDASPMDCCALELLKSTLSELRSRPFKDFGRLFKRKGTKYLFRNYKRNYCHGNYGVERYFRIRVTKLSV